jgi:histidinol-phosphate aminotransferase
MDFLRPGLPTSYGFGVAEVSHRAKLDQNEAPWDLPEEVKKAVLDTLAAREWNRYVQPAEYVRAKSVVASAYSVDEEALALVGGADQGLEAAMFLAGGPGRRALWLEPTYPFIAHIARRTHTEASPVRVGAASELEKLAREGDYDLIFLVSPNNPTGDRVPDEVVTAALASGKLVVVDEAYGDFASQPWLPRASEHENLLVIRSLSKSMVAGAHVGFVVGDPRVIATVEALYTAPYHLNMLQLSVAKHIASIRPALQATVASVLEQRAVLKGALNELPGVTARESDANFILFRVGDTKERADSVYRAVAEDGVRIRNVSGLPGLEGYLRVTVGTEEENQIFLATVAKALA